MYLMGLSWYLSWRKGWDSNPRTGSSPITRFRVERVTASSLPFHNGVLYTKSGLRASLFSPQATEEEGRKTALQKNPTSSGKSPKQISPICSENMMPEQYEDTERIHAKLPRPSSHPHRPLPRTTYSGSFLLSSISA